MKNKLKKSVFVMLGIVLMLTMMSCNSKPSNDNPSNDNFPKEYLRCNATSQGNMAEIESGFYYHTGRVLYYADRSDMSNWVAVCNKPDCPHEWDTLDCHANIGPEIAQKEDNIYFYAEEYYSEQGYIYQVAKDGSEPIEVYEVPLDYSGVDGGRAIISQEVFLKYHKTLGEEGFYIKTIYRLEEDGSLYTLFSQKYENDFGVLTIPSYANQVRGDFTIMSSLLIEQGEDIQNVLFRVDGDVPERVNLPKDVLVLWSYLTEDTFTYYKPNQGFFEIDLESQTETCIMENQLSDARGYALTQEYFLECNRYKYNKPEEAYMRFYDGSKWIDVALPELVAKTDCYFSPVSVATDRVFFTLNNEVANQLYYFMLNETNPSLKLATTILGDEKYFQVIESEEESESEEDASQLNITIFDTEEYTAKVTGIGFDKTTPDLFYMKVFFENKTDNTLTIFINHLSLNGASYYIGNGVTAKPHETTEYLYRVSGLSQAYEGIDWTSELTNIVFSSQIGIEGTYDYEYGPFIITEFYPYGEENATFTVREPLPTDDILIDNEFIKLTATQYWSKEDKTANVKFIVENKTDKMINFATSEVISVNGQSLNQSIATSVVVMPKSYSTFEFEEWFEEVPKLKEIVGDEVKEYKANLKLYHSTDLGWEVIWEDAILLSPKR